MRNILIAILIVLHSSVVSSEIFHSSSVSQEVWDKVTPYLMKSDHPAKPILDTLFSKPNVIQNRETLIASGFSVSKPRKFDNIFIAKHKKLKGYILKLYTDEQGNLPDWFNWVKRAKGALVIRNAIARHGYQNMFSVPKKWIYPLPRIAQKPEDKSFILVVEDMDLEKSSANKAKWQSTHSINRAKLQALYVLLKEEGLIDSVYIDNIPFSKTEHIAFIDTEHFHVYDKGLRYDKLTSHLPEKYQSYWIELTTQ